MSLVLRLSAIGAILLGAGAAFTYVAGWLAPQRLGLDRITDALEKHDGLHPGFRRAHAKGLCFEGSFQGNGTGVTLSRAAVFEPEPVPVIGRFSTGGGQPYAPDGRLVFHALALSLVLPNGEQWRMAMDNAPIFPVATPQAFLAFQLATAPDPRTGKPDPNRVAEFLARHPETQAFLDWQRYAPLAASFANGTYYSINTFRFVDAMGEQRFVRWSFVPETPFEAIDKATLAERPANFLFDDLLARLSEAPLRWHMIITLAESGDPVDDATRVWPADRGSIDVGTLTLTRAAIEETGACRNITFDPTILPSGVAPSDDPLLAARSAVYATSLARRDGEPAEPSALGRDPAARSAR
ncbi:catalase family peroxidase [Reyranella sp.]|uniref:catalase family peroxidase n=1 Tax=Reyranella sp. TaxID=1929291 RepID=UPI003D12D9D6